LLRVYSLSWKLVYKVVTKQWLSLLVIMLHYLIYLPIIQQMSLVHHLTYLCNLSTYLIFPI
jgi:hypothetical protein